MIRENWVLVDLLHVYHQIGVDVFETDARIDCGKAATDTSIELSWPGASRFIYLVRLGVYRDITDPWIILVAL